MDYCKLVVEGHKHPVTYFSRALTKRVCPTYDRGQWQRGTRWIISGIENWSYTTPENLEQEDLFGRKATMIHDIDELEPCIEFIRGQDNFMADALTRLSWNTKLPNDEDPIVVTAI